MKYINQIKFLAIVCILLGSCTEKNRSDEKAQTIDAVCDSVKNVNIETVKLDSVSTSYEIETSVVNGQIVGVDRYFCYVYRFMPNGKMVKRQLGQGSAKNETTMGRIAGHCFSNDGKLILVGYEGETCVYDSSINREGIFVADYSKRSPADLATTDCYEKPLVYTKQYFDFICREYGGKLYYNVDMFTPVFNIVNTPDTHISRAYRLMSVDYSNKGETALWLKGLPPFYDDNTKQKALFTNSHFDISNDGDVYIAHEADSLVYMYDVQQNLKLICGRAASGMQQDYAECGDMSDYRKHYEKEHETKGRFTSLEYVDQTGMLFRTYQKDGSAKHDGMQIYKEGVLVGDVSVPRGMHVVGYISPYYYSQIISDEDKGELKIYRFKL